MGTPAARLPRPVRYNKLRDRLLEEKNTEMKVISQNSQYKKSRAERFWKRTREGAVKGLMVHYTTLITYFRRS